MLRIGLLVNPYAGIGGSVALKGSDGVAIREEALRLGASLRAVERAHRALAFLEGAILAKAEVSTALASA